MTPPVGRTTEVHGLVGMVTLLGVNGKAVVGHEAIVKCVIGRMPLLKTDFHAPKRLTLRTLQIMRRSYPMQTEIGV